MKAKKMKGVSMKGRFRAILAGAFACALALVTVVPAYATSTSAGTDYNAEHGTGSKSSLVVSTANNGDSLGAFQVISIDYKSDNTLDYQFTQDFQDFLKSPQYTAYTTGGGKAIATVDDYKTLTSVAAGETGDLSKLLDAFTAYVKANGKTAKYTETATNGTATFANVDKGQYIIVGMGNGSGALVYQTVTAEVEPKADGGTYKLNDKYTVAMKTTQPTPEKKITGGTTDDAGKPTVSVGDTVNYELSATVPMYPSTATNTTFYMQDTLSNGLSLKSKAEDIVVKGDGTTLTMGDDYTVTIDGQKLYIDFKYEKIKSYKKLTAAYDAILNENAKIGSTTGNPNTYDLIWSNNPFNGGTHTDHPTGPGYGKDTKEKTVYSYALRIEKVDEKNPDEHLKGATFQILASDKTTVVGTITTDDNGFAAFSGLEAGTYYLKETVAPTGYKLQTDLIQVDLNGTTATHGETIKTEMTYTTKQSEAQIPTQAVDDATGNPLWLPENATPDTKPTAAATAPAGMVPAYLKSVTTTVTSTGATGSTQVAEGFYEVLVKDAPGSNLPSTGGMGTTILYVIGGILVIGSAVFMITKKRMANAEK